MEAVGQAKKLFSFKQLHLTPDDYNEKRWLVTVALSYSTYRNTVSVSKAMVSIPDTENSIEKAAILDFKMAAMWNYVFPHNFSSK